MKTLQVDASLCQFAADLEVTPRGDESHKSTPFKAKARSGEPVHVPGLGLVVNDFSGMQHKNRIPIDHNHTPTLVGYANKFPVEDGHLYVHGAITPNKYDATAETIIENAENGVPYEMSVTFDNAKIERIDEGENVTVNGREFTGPLAVVREWRLRGVAITPYGRDAETSLQFSQGETVTVTEIEKEETMSDEIKTDAVEVEETQAVETAEVENSAEPVAVAEAATAVDAQPEVQTGQPSELAQKFMGAFGEDRGSWYFAHGVSFDDAMVAELKRVQKDNDDLRKKVDSQSQLGADDAVAFSADPSEAAEPGKDANGNLTSLGIKLG